MGESGGGKKIDSNSSDLHSCHIFIMSSLSYRFSQDGDYNDKSLYFYLRIKLWGAERSTIGSRQSNKTTALGNTSFFDTSK